MLPFHPTVAHLPIVITLLLPILVLVFALMIQANKMSPKAWLIIVGLQITATATGYIALESGEKEEHTVEKVVSKKLIHEHEEAAEVFVGSTVLALVLGVAAFFIRKEFSLYLKLAVMGVTLVSSYLGYQTGNLGADLVYKYGAASAYTNGASVNEAPQGILPTPGQNTSESPYPVEEDENEYSPEEDDVKDED